ncbi:MAG: CBS domain-containing protein [Opitutaceae bacterium]|nr:CBS domain-containing protein [Opitutaceae bacterium]
MNTPVAVLLNRKGSAVTSVAASDTIADAVRVMNEKKIGSVLVTEGGFLVGIFTERDVLTRVVPSGVNPQTTKVKEVMTGKLETITPDTKLGEVMDLFSRLHCRHLPVIVNGELLGLISIGDVSRWLADTHRAEAEHLRQYIAGGYPTS